MTWSDIAAVVAAVGGVLVAWWQLRRVQLAHPSQKVRDGVSIVQAAGDLLEDYRVEVKLLRSDIDAMRKDLGADRRRIESLEESLAIYRRGVDILVAQLRGLGVTPDWTPPHQGKESTG